MFNPAAPCCECKGPSPVILATKQMGAGYIVLCAVNFSFRLETPFNNAPLWLNIRSLGGGGPVGCVGKAEIWANMMVAAWPTVENVNTPAALAGIKVLYSGLFANSFSNPFPTQVVPQSMWTAVRDWVKAGNVLVVSCGEYDGATGQLLADAQSINKMFRSFGIPCRFTNERRDDDPTGLGPNPGLQVPHWLVDGTLGYPMCGFWHFGATGICGADPAYLAGTDPAVRPSCTGGAVFTKCCPDIPLPRTVLLTTERGTIDSCVLTYSGPTTPLGVTPYGWGAPTNVNLAGSSGPQSIFALLLCLQNSGTPGLMRPFNLALNFVGWRPVGYTGIIEFDYQLVGPGNSCSPLTLTQDVEFGFQFGNSFIVLNTDTIHIAG